MKEDRKDSEMNREDLFPWSTLAKVAAAVVAVGGIAIHFMGLVGHMSYLRAWGVDAGLFPKPIDWLMTNGAAALVDRTVVALAAANTITGRLLFGAVPIAMFFVAALILFPLGHGGDLRRRRGTTRARDF